MFGKCFSNQLIFLKFKENDFPSKLKENIFQNFPPTSNYNFFVEKINLKLILKKIFSTSNIFTELNYLVLKKIQRFFPSEFAMDVDRINAVEPIKSTFVVQAQIRRAVEAAEIPYTYVSCNYFARYFIPNLAPPGATAPPRDKVIIPGDGNVKGKSKKITPLI